VPLHLDPQKTALVEIDMHRGHLDPAVATLPLPAERCGPLIARSVALFDALRGIGVPIVHVVTEYRDSLETQSNPFKAAINADPTKKRRGTSRHQILGGPGVEIIPELYRDGDYVVHGKKRFSAFLYTDLQFLLSRRLQVDTLIIAGVNTTSCILCSSFEATNLDYRVIVASDACDTMDGQEAHEFALKLIGNIIGWPLTNDEILAAFGREPSGRGVGSLIGGS
jgi:nicotinamidase-related amidase